MTHVEKNEIIKQKKKLAKRNISDCHWWKLMIAIPIYSFSFHFQTNPLERSRTHIWHISVEWQFFPFMFMKTNELQCKRRHFVVFAFFFRACIHRIKKRFYNFSPFGFSIQRMKLTKKDRVRYVMRESWNVKIGT